MVTGFTKISNHMVIKFTCTFNKERILVRSQIILNIFSRNSERFDANKQFNYSEIK